MLNESEIRLLTVITLFVSNFKSSEDSHGFNGKEMHVFESMKRNLKDNICTN